MLSQLAFRILKHSIITQILVFLKRLPILTAWTVGTLLVLVVGLEIVWIIVVSPLWQAIQLTQDGEAVGLFEVTNKVQPQILKGLQAVLPGLGGLALSGTAFAAIRNLRVAEDTRRIAEEKQVTDLFVKAVEMLGDKERTEVRIGAIYALERVAKNSTRDHWTVMEVLTAFIQKEASGVASLKAFSSKASKYREDKLEFASNDVEAAMRVIGRREGKDPPGKTLSFINANISGVDFEYGANFQNANFAGAYCMGASLASGIFKSAQFIRADLRGSYLYWADFTNVNFRQAKLMFAHIDDAILTDADLEGANLQWMEGREAAQIVAAKNWWLAKYDDEFAQELTEFAQKQAKRDPKFVDQLRLFEQNRQAQNSEPEDTSDTSG